MFGAAVARHQAGALIEAEHQYRQILTLVPGNAEAESRLGAVLMAQGKTGDALPHLERAAALKPDSFETFGNLAQAYLAAGVPDRALTAAECSLALRETPQGRNLFVQCARSVRLAADDGRLRKLILRALAEGWARPRDLTGVAISLIKLNPAVHDCAARANSAWPARRPAAQLFGATDLEALAGDTLLKRLLECDPITDLTLERLLTNVRSVMLADIDSFTAADEDVLEFCCALARQCFINDYVFSTTDAEMAAAGRLRKSLEQALAAGESCSPLQLAVFGAYFPLHTLAEAAALLARAWPRSIDELIARQIKEPAREREIAATIPALTGMAGEVSYAVRQQYEESPYPRWVAADSQATRSEDPPGKPFDALIAGCGTGLSTFDFARQAPNARILAIDLSLASLSYAKRMAQRFGLADIDFVQADIMNLGPIGRQFDVIDASGVLHHLRDPWQGWRILLSLLRPGGAMHIGLYSALARRNIVAARALIAARGYRPVAEDIRRCRDEIAVSTDPLLKSLTGWGDFFSTNECRDMLFHVEEHSTTLGEIKSFLAANSVQFTGFLVDARTVRRFAARFPRQVDLTDLDCWEAFEADAPLTFANMYQFWVRKPAA